MDETGSKTPGALPVLVDELMNEPSCLSSSWWYESEQSLLPVLRYLMSLRGHVGSVYQVAWSADSRLLVSGSSDSTLKVWDVKTGKLNMDLPGHADEASRVI